MAFATRTTTYLTRVVHATTEDVDAALHAVLEEHRLTVAAHGARLSVVQADMAPPPPGTRYWAARRYVGRLRTGRWSPSRPVELELMSWSDAAAELGLRYCGRVRPGERYFDAAGAVLAVLAFDVEARVAVERVSRFLTVVSGHHETAEPTVDARA